MEKFYSFLSHVDLIPAVYHDLPYSKPELRYALRMRPFLSISLPEVPSYPEFTALVSVRSAVKPGVQGSRPSTTDLNEQALNILDVAEEALKVARKEWEAISKANAETARCVGCEDWWRTSVKNVLRACITANIGVATAKKITANTSSTGLREKLKVEIMESEKGYHAWWVVPKISAK